MCVLIAGCTSAAPSGPKELGGENQLSREFVRLPKASQPLYGERGNEGWRTSGYRPHPIRGDHKPYTAGLLSEGVLPAPVDAHGVRLYELDGRRFFHPVATFQYALAKLDIASRTGSRRALRAAIANANAALDASTKYNHGLYFPYPFDFPLGGKRSHTIQAPWWSGMAQGYALSLFTRLYGETGDQKWQQAAHATFLTMDDRGPRDAPWTVYVSRRGYLWYEEYAGNTKPLLVLNGDIFAIFGLYDYYRLTQSGRAARLFDAAVTTLREYLPAYRSDGDVSYYCLRAPFCQRKLWQNAKYHGIVTTQMNILADMTDDPWFRDQAKIFRSDSIGKS